MASITGKAGYVTKEVSAVDTLVTAIRSWSIDYTVDTVDVTEMSSTAPVSKSFVAVLASCNGTITANHTDGAEQLTPGTSYNLMLNVDANTAYYGAAFITGKGVNIVVDGEAMSTYPFQFNGKCYILGAELVVDGGFTAASSAAWDVSDEDVAYDTTNDQLDFSGAADVPPDTPGILTDTYVYYTSITVSNWGSGSVAHDIGGTAGTSRGADGTYVEFITAAGTDYKIVGAAGTYSVDRVSVRLVQN